MTAVDACVVKNSDASTRRVLLKNNKRFRVSLVVCTVLAGLSGCATSNQTDDVFRIDRAQGSQENIASLTSVINANPQDPEGYNVRGSAYGRAGDSRRAIEDFNKALQLNPRFYQAYANRALVYRNSGQQQQALQDYNAALQINASYDVALIGRGNLYRQSGRVNEASFQRLLPRHRTRNHRWPRVAQSWPDLPAAQPACPGHRGLLQGHLAVLNLAGTL